jgi:AcrR family transcriptional regulator
VSHRTVYSYYQNKQDIFHAGGVEVGTTFLAEVRPSRLSNDATPQQVIRRENERYLRWHKSNSRWLAVAEEASGTDEVAHSIKRWQATGLIDASIAADPTAGALVSMMTNFAYWLYEAGDQYDEAEAIETVTAVWLRAVGLAVS